jgi:hypothetical protein
VDDDDVGYTAKDGTIFVKVRNPSATEGVRSACFYAYSFVLATLLHELVHLSHLGHGKVFYRCLSAAVSACGAETNIKREARAHVCAELLNAICDNDARRARGLLAVLPEAVMCRRPGAENSQLPLEYAAHHGRVALTRLLLEARADPALCGGASAGSGMAPLMRAAANGNTKTAALLLAAGANVADPPQPPVKSVLDKAMAAAEVGGFAGKGGEWWKVAKVLSESNSRPTADVSTSQTAPPQQRSRSVATRSNSRRRRQRRGDSESGTSGEVSASIPSASKRSLSMPALPAVANLPPLPGSEVRRPVTYSSLAGSLAL